MIFSIPLRIKIIALFILGFSSVQVVSQVDTLWAPVIIYDFKALDEELKDFENPNFDCAHNDQKKPEEWIGTVESFLDDDLRPIFKENKNCNEHLDLWYRPSGVISDGKFDTASFQWDPSILKPHPTNPDEFVGNNWDESDSLANIVMYDSLPFILNDTTGLYEIENNSFFPIDGMGWGNQPRNKHNYGFTVELHHNFAYQSALEFNFTGDDDLFLFINGELVLDLGGVHSKFEATVKLDTLVQRLGLEEGKIYRMDVYYAERQTSQSNLKITTNIIGPQDIRFYRKPGPPDPVTNPPVPFTELKAGVIDTFYTKVFDKDGEEIVSLADDVKIEVLEGEDIQVTQGPNGQFIFDTKKAHQEVVIKVSVKDPKNEDNEIIQEITLTVQPGDPNSISLEESDTPDNYTPFDFGTPTMGLSSPPLDVYAYLRDANGNLIGPANSVSANIAPDFLNLTKGPDGDHHYQVGYKPGPGGQATLTVSGPGLVSDEIVFNTEPSTSPAILSAITMDADGNGYLDGIEITFQEALRASGQYDLPLATVTYQNTTWSIDRVEGVRDNVNKTFVLHLVEDNSTVAQTGWTPKITLPNAENPDNKITDYTTMDGAGPVLVSAVSTPTNPGQPNTLLLEFSETMNEVKLSSSTKFNFDWKRINSIQGEAEILGIQVGSDNNFTYSFRPGSSFPVPGDSLKIKTGDTTAIDLKQNLSNMSYYVEIEGSLPVPSIDSAITLDQDGNGYLDAVLVVFTSPLLTSGQVDLNAATLTLNETNWTVSSFTGDRDGVNKQHILYLNEVNTTPAQTGWRPRMTIPNPENASLGISNRLLDDGAGPVIVEATSVAGAPGTQNKLLLRFSEALDLPSLAATEEFPYDWIQVASSGNNTSVQRVGIEGTNGYLYEFVNPSTVPLPGDSLKIKTNHEAVVDESDNLSIMSYYVPVTGSFPLPGITSSYTRDNDGNGLLDAVYIRFSEPPDPGQFALNQAMITNGEITFLVDRVEGDVDGANHEFTIHLFENSDSIPQTGWTPSLSLNNEDFTGTGINGHRVNDGAGPVILSAVSQGQNENRTLEITFSEPMNLLNLKNEIEFPYEVILPSGATASGILVARVEEVKKNNNTAENSQIKAEYYFREESLIPLPGDSIRIIPGHQSVTDIPVGNKSNMSFYVRVEGDPPLVNPVVQPPRFQKPVVIGPIITNPVTTDNSIVLLDPDGVAISDDPEQNRIARAGGPILVIEVDNRPHAVEVYFYDHLGQYINKGNHIITDAEWAKVSQNKTSEGTVILNYGWNPVTEKGLQVGTSAYLAKGRVIFREGEYTNIDGQYEKMVDKEYVFPIIRFGYTRGNEVVSNQ